MTDTLQSRIIIASLLLVACLGIGYFFTSSQWTNYSVTKSVLAQKQTEKEGLKSALARAQNFVNDYKAKSKDASIVDLALPVSNPDLSNLIATLGEQAKSSGLALSNFSIVDVIPTTGAVSANGIQTQKITLKASGNYASFKDFILRLQTGLRIMDVDQITARAEENGDVEYQITLRTYYQK